MLFTKKDKNQSDPLTKHWPSLRGFWQKSASCHGGELGRNWKKSLDLDLYSVQCTACNSDWNSWWMNLLSDPFLVDHHQTIEEKRKHSMNSIQIAAIYHSRSATSKSRSWSVPTSKLKEQAEFCSENSKDRHSDFSLHSSAHLNKKSFSKSQ